MRKEKSFINSRAILDYVRGHTNLDPELDDLPDPEGFLRETNNWAHAALYQNCLKGQD